MTKTPTQKVIDLARRKKILRPKDLDALNIPREYLVRLYKQGTLKRPGRGIYVPADAEPNEHQTLVEAGKRVPQGVACLLTALQFHDLTTQSPFEIWMAIENKARKPRIDYPPLRIVRFSGEALKAGVEEHKLGRVRVRVYCPAKTVADCFKFRNKIGLDVALEALRDCWKQKKATMDELWKYAKICRVANVMKPYMQSLT